MHLDVVKRGTPPLGDKPPLTNPRVEFDVCSLLVFEESLNRAGRIDWAAPAELGMQRGVSDATSTL